MLQNIDTIIFDMDGVIIDSEPFWREAAILSFKEFGLELTVEQCTATTGLRTKEVVKYWLPDKSLKIKNQAEKRILSNVVSLISENGVPVHGLSEVMNFLRKNKFKIGLATSSPSKVIDAVLNVCLPDFQFDVIQSAEKLRYGKPHPQVYLNTLRKLKSKSINSIAIEDSINGIIAAKAARLKVVSIPAADEFESPKFSIADFKIKKLSEIVSLLNQGIADK
jgi:sugar-phosphatase